MEGLLPVTTNASSNRYRSNNDVSHEVCKKFLLADTPGHGKLRHHAVSNITNPQNIKGILFMVDAAEIATSDAVMADNEALRETAEYLYNILLLLQKRALNTKSSKGPSELPLLIAANKQDLFTALPARMIKTRLESEISKIRISRSKGLLDSGIGMNDMDEEKEWLGD